jgi:outer membrane protein W
MQRECDLDIFITLLGKFPPYHGQGYNYTKDEVEDWLSETKSVLMKRKASFQKEGVKR